MRVYDIISFLRHFSGVCRTISIFRTAIKNKFFHSYIFNHLVKYEFALQFLLEDYFFSCSVFFHKSVFQKKCNSRVVNCNIIIKN